MGLSVPTQWQKRGVQWMNWTKYELVEISPNNDNVNMKLKKYSE